MMKARFAKDGKLGPVEMSSLQPPPPPKTYGIKVRVRLHATQEEVLLKAREAVEYQDVPQITDPSVNFIEFEYIKKEYDEIVATDVRGVLFPYVHQYNRYTGTKTIPVAEFWSVIWKVYPNDS